MASTLPAEPTETMSKQGKNALEDYASQAMAMFIDMRNWNDNSTLTYDLKLLEEHKKKMQEMVEVLTEYQHFFVAFHAPKGDGFNLCKTYLENFLPYKEALRCDKIGNEHKLFDGSVTIKKEMLENQPHFNIEVKQKEDIQEYDSPEVDINLLLFIAEERHGAARLFDSFLHSNKPRLHAVAISLVEAAVKGMRKDKRKRFRSYGQLLYTTYMNPKYRFATVKDICDTLSCGTTKYYELKNEAISELSRQLFGFDLSGNPFTDYDIKDGKITIPY